MFANDDELAQMGPLTDDDLDIWKGLPVGQRDSVQGNSPAMGTDSQKFKIEIKWSVSTSGGHLAR